MNNDICRILKNRNLKILKEISEGYSEDCKFCVEDKEQKKYMLRISKSDNLAQKKLEEKILNSYCECEKNVVPRCIEVNEFEKSKIYTIHTWVDGNPLKESLRFFSDVEQYNMGVQAGKVLRNIHNIKVDETDSINKSQYIFSIYDKINLYRNCPNKIENDKVLLDYISENINNPVLYNNYSYLHGDFQLVNFLYIPKQNLVGVIDFERCRVGNRYEDFFSTEFYDRRVSISFAKGIIQGYFGEIPPDEFWEALTFYCAVGAIETMLWATNLGNKEVKKCRKRIKTMIEDFNSYKNIIPNWYE